MKEKSSKDKASEKYRLKNKEYYNEYYRKYREQHKPKNYPRLYKDRLDKIIDKLYTWGEALPVEFQQETLKIARGDYDEV